MSFSARELARAVAEANGDDPVAVAEAIGEAVQALAADPTREGQVDLATLPQCAAFALASIEVTLAALGDEVLSAAAGRPVNLMASAPTCVFL